MNIYFNKYLKHRPSTSTHLYVFLEELDFK